MASTLIDSVVLDTAPTSVGFGLPHGEAEAHRTTASLSVHIQNRDKKEAPSLLFNREGKTEAARSTLSSGGSASGGGGGKDSVHSCAGNGPLSSSANSSANSSRLATATRQSLQDMKKYHNEKMSFFRDFIPPPLPPLFVQHPSNTAAATSSSSGVDIRNTHNTNVLAAHSSSLGSGGKGNTTSSIGLGGGLTGFAMPLPPPSSVARSRSLSDGALGSGAAPAASIFEGPLMEPQTLLVAHEAEMRELREQQSAAQRRRQKRQLAFQQRQAQQEREYQAIQSQFLALFKKLDAEPVILTTEDVKAQLHCDKLEEADREAKESVYNLHETVSSLRAEVRRASKAKELRRQQEQEEVRRLEAEREELRRKEVLQREMEAQAAQLRATAEAEAATRRHQLELERREREMHMSHLRDVVDNLRADLEVAEEKNRELEEESHHQLQLAVTRSDHELESYRRQLTDLAHELSEARDELQKHSLADRKKQEELDRQHREDVQQMEERIHELHSQMSSPREVAEVPHAGGSSARSRRSRRSRRGRGGNPSSGHGSSAASSLADKLTPRLAPVRRGGASSIPAASLLPPPLSISKTSAPLVGLVGAGAGAGAGGGRGISGGGIMSEKPLPLQGFLSESALQSTLSTPNRSSSGGGILKVWGRMHSPDKSGSRAGSPVMQVRRAVEALRHNVESAEKSETREKQMANSVSVSRSFAYPSRERAPNSGRSAPAPRRSSVGCVDSEDDDGDAEEEEGSARRRGHSGHAQALRPPPPAHGADGNVTDIVLEVAALRDAVRDFKARNEENYRNAQRAFDEAQLTGTVTHLPPHHHHHGGRYSDLDSEEYDDEDLEDEDSEEYDDDAAAAPHRSQNHRHMSGGSGGAYNYDDSTFIMSEPPIPMLTREEVMTRMRERLAAA